MRRGLALWAALTTLGACAQEAPRGRAPGELPDNRAPGASEEQPAEVLELDFEPLQVEGELDRPTALAFIPGSDDELIVLTQGRTLLHMRLAGDRLERLGSLVVPRSRFEGDCGLISLAFDPDFVDNGYLYLSMCLTRTHSGVVRLTLGGELALVGETMVEILVEGDSRAVHPRHNVGAIGFDGDGVMWALFGEKAQADNAQDPATPLGALLRFIPSRDPEEGGHEPAPDAFFAGDGSADARVHAYGLRSPWTGVMDRMGRVWIGDVGSRDVEEVNLLAEGGENFGWSSCEGPCEEQRDALRDPITSWVHGEDGDYVLDDPQAAPTTKGVVWVGAGHRADGGAEDPYGGLLTDRVLVSDMCVGFLRALRADDDGQLVEDIHVGHLGYITGVAQGPDGYLYFSTFGTVCETQRAEEPAGGIHRAVGMVRAR